VELPEGEDPDSYLQQHSGADFLQYAETARTFLDYLLARAQRSSDLRTPSGQADCVTRIAPLLRKIDNHIERWGYFTVLAEKIGVPPEVLQRELSSRTVTSSPPTRMPGLSEERSQRPPAKTRSEEYTLLQVLCHAPHLLASVRQQITVDDFDDADLREIYALMVRLHSQASGLTLAELSHQAVQPLQAQLLTKMAVEPVSLKPAELQQALDDCLTRIRQRHGKVQRQQLIQQLRTVGDSGAQERLLQAYSQLRKETPAI
jgi:DNA primase